MFDLEINERLEYWLKFRNRLEKSKNPGLDTWEFWKNAPFIPYNKEIDPYSKHSWPTPWEIIANNKYDDFTKALMIGTTLKFTKRMKNTLIELKTLEDENFRQYNLIYVDATSVINYSDNGPVDVSLIPIQFKIKNQLELDHPR